MTDYQYDECIDVGNRQSGPHHVYPSNIYANPERMHEHRWQFREFARIHTGVYKRLPNVVRERLREELPKAAYDACYQIHFPHMSESQKGMVAYTESIDKGSRDIQSVTKIGRFLTRVLKVSDQRVIKSISESMSLATGYDHAENTNVNFTNDPSEIADIYQTCGVESCMDKPTDHFSTGGTHPVETYHPEDWKLAYLRDGDGCIYARAMVTREMTYNRCYPDGSAGGELGAALQAMGYRQKHSAAIGMRLLRVEYRGGFVGPYVDGDCVDVYDDREVLWIGSYPSEKSCWCVGNSQEAYDNDGVIRDGGRGVECSDCEDTYDEDEMTTVDEWGECRICPCCIDNYRYNNLSDCWLREDDAVYVAYHDTYCDADECVQCVNGDWELEHECEELTEGGFMHREDDELTTLDDGRYTHQDNAVYTDNGWQHIDDCVENEDGEYVLAQTEMEV